jgi:hypothetical protein
MRKAHGDQTESLVPPADPASAPPLDEVGGGGEVEPGELSVIGRGVQAGQRVLHKVRVLVQRSGRGHLAGTGRRRNRVDALGKCGGAVREPEAEGERARHCQRGAGLHPGPGKAEHGLRHGERVAPPVRRLRRVVVQHAPGRDARHGAMPPARQRCAHRAQQQSAIPGCCATSTGG